jgi:hypothetical protein
VAVVVVEREMLSAAQVLQVAVAVQEGKMRPVRPVHLI